jgi:hypothetical protein
MNCLSVDTYVILLIHFAEICKNSDTLAKIVNCIFLQMFLLLVVYTFYYMCVEKHMGTIILIYIHSSFCILNFMLPACRPNFFKVACITEGVEQASCGCPKL